MKRLRYLAWGLVALNTIDAVSTLVAVQSGIAQEQNPLMRALLELHPLSFLVFKFLVGVLVLALLYHREVIRNTRPMTIAVGTLVAMYSAILLQHIRVWASALWL